MKRFLRISMPILTFCVVAFILLNAFTDDVRATANRDAVVKVVTGHAAFAKQVMRVVAKSFHVVEYAFFSFCLTASVLLFGDLCRRFERVLLCGLMLALTDELIQSTSSGRGSRVTDIAVDTAGILIGYAVAVLMNAIINKIQKKKGT